MKPQKFQSHFLVKFYFGQDEMATSHFFRGTLCALCTLWTKCYFTSNMSFDIFKRTILTI